MSILVADIEANGLYDNVTEIHCIVLKDKSKDNTEQYYDKDIVTDYPRHGSIKDGIRRLAEADLVIGHNWIDYDCRVIKKFFPEFKININKIRDTLIRSHLTDPHRLRHIDCPVSKTTINGRSTIGPHSLENWGYIVGQGKVEHEDWTTFTADMLHRCVEDVFITDKVDNRLNKDMSNHDWSKCEKIENQFRFIMSEQESYGVTIDSLQLAWCIEQLRAERVNIDERLYRLIPPIVTGVEKPTKGLKKNGEPTTNSIKWLGHEYIVGDFCKIEINPVNLNSQNQLKEYLLSCGWVPTEWNFKKEGKKILKDDKGRPIKSSPKITEDSLDSVQGEGGKLVVRRVLLQHRLSQLKGWKEIIRPDGKIGAGGNSVGTNTGRVTHRKVVNVPGVEAFFGKEIRSIFSVPKKYKMVGSDLSALENRIAAHFTYNLDGGIFARRILKEDPHQYIADQLGIERSKAKALNYAIMYGAGVGKIAEMMNTPAGKAKILIAQWWDANPALKLLKEKIDKALRIHPGYIKGIDGRKIFIRSSHSAMNALFQNAGSIVNKVATIFIYNKIKKYNLDANLVINMHDEQQAEVIEGDIDLYKNIVLRCYQEAGKYFNLNIPIEGEVKVGNNWCETH